MGHDVVGVAELGCEGRGRMVRNARRAPRARAFGFKEFVFARRRLGRAHDRRSDLASTHLPVGGDDGLEHRAIGAPRSRGYEPPSRG